MLVLVSLPEGKVQLGIFGNGSGGMDQGAWIISLSDVWIMAMDWGYGSPAGPGYWSGPP